MTRFLVVLVAGAVSCSSPTFVSGDGEGGGGGEPSEPDATGGRTTSTGGSANGSGGSGGSTGGAQQTGGSSSTGGASTGGVGTGGSACSSTCQSGTPHCEEDAGACVECLDDDDCNGSPNGSKCFTSSFGYSPAVTNKCGECHEGETRHCASVYGACEGEQTCSFGSWPESSGCVMENGGTCTQIGPNGCTSGVPAGVRCDDGLCYPGGHVCAD